MAIILRVFAVTELHPRTERPVAQWSRHVKRNGLASSDAFGQYFFQATLNQSNSVEEGDLSDVLLTVWPNPATDIIQFNTSHTPSSSRCIELFDAQGKKMYEMMNTSKTSIDVSSFPKGSYTLVFRTENEIVSQQVVVE